MLGVGMSNLAGGSGDVVSPDPREDPKRRSLNGGSYKVPIVV